LDVGAIGPDEIAFSIMAEMMAVRHGLDTGHIRSLSARD
jgi:xanthine/CO dehydrogenase XdhC/CoxF family maturation factor